MSALITLLVAIHREAVPGVAIFGAPGELRVVLVQLLQPAYTHLRPTFSRLPPQRVEIGRRTVVLA